jgi:hypothetical protein
MKKLKSCPSCGHEISSNGRVVCPNCGGKSGISGTAKGCLFSILIVAIFSTILAVSFIVAFSLNNYKESKPGNSLETAIVVTTKDLSQLSINEAIDQYRGKYIKVSAYLNRIETGQFWAGDNENEFIINGSMVFGPYRSYVIDSDVGQKLTLLGIVKDIKDDGTYIMELEQALESDYTFINIGEASDTGFQKALDDLEKSEAFFQEAREEGLRILQESEIQNQAIREESLTDN